MDHLRTRLGFSLHSLEVALFKRLAQEFARLFVVTLEEIDAWLAQQRDRRRFRLKDKDPRTLQTLFGVEVTFSRRRYLDRHSGKSVYLLDEVLQLPAQKQVSPALGAWALGQAVLTNSYRGACRSLQALYGHQVLSHESIRQVVLAMGQGLQKEQEERLQEAEGTRKARVVFLEVDGLSVALQRGKQRRVEEKLLTVHEGWRQRHPASDEYELVNKRHFRTQAQDFWESASRFVYSLYDIDEETVVVINGDRARWIRQGVSYFPNAIYQVDAFHLLRELRELFDQDGSAMAQLVQARQTDVTGATFMAKLAQACAGLRDAKKRERCQALLRDLADIPDAAVDYRLRLAAREIPTQGLRGLGAAESQADTFADRVKHRGRSWSCEGLAAIMEVLCWRNTERLDQVMNRVEVLLARAEETVEGVKGQVVRMAKRLLDESVETMQAHAPIKSAGRTRSGGMSHFMHRIISGASG